MYNTFKEEENLVQPGKTAAQVASPRHAPRNIPNVKTFAKQSQ